MSLTHPAALWLLALAVPVVLLHVLRPRRQAVVVSSTYLWRDLSSPVSAASPWQRLRPSILLFLQLLAVVLLALAAARPVHLTDAPLARHTVFILDTSGSMAATDGQPDRLGEAKARARGLRRQLPGGGLASLVVASPEPRVALSASPDTRAFSEALGAVPPAAGAADFAGAFNLAESLESPGVPVGFLLLSDGGLDPAARRLLPPGTRYERIGERTTNRAITRLAVEPRGSGLHALVALRNTGGPSATQTLRLDVDGRTVKREQVSLPAGALVEREYDLPGGERVEAFLGGEDLLGADDHAFATAGLRRQLRVLLAGPDDVFLERLLAAVPGVTVERTPDSRPAPGADLAVYDGVAVPPDPGAPFLAIAPPGGAPGVKSTGDVDQPAVTLVRAEHPLLAGLDLSAVGVAKAQRLEPSGGNEVLVASEETPLLVRGTRGGRPFVYLGFGLADSNLPLQVAFPVLGDRLLTDLAGSTATPGDLRAGQPIPVPSAAAVTVTRPGGARIEVPAGASGPVADRPGFYTVSQAGKPPTTVAVNAAPTESELTPAQRLPSPPRPSAPGERPPAGEVSLLRLVVAALLVVLALELLASRRRRGVSRGQWRAGLVVRGVIVACLVAALLGVTLPRRGGGVATVFLVDASDSMGPAGREEALAWVRESLGKMPPEARAGVALFGADARVELTVAQRAHLGDSAVQVDTSRTNLAGALRLGAALLPSDARRRIVVVSDGRANDGDAAAEARRLSEAGIAVDVHPVAAAGGPDVAVARLAGPGRARRGESFVLSATVVATRAGPVRVTLRRDDAVIEERAVDLPVGETTVEFNQTAGEAGLARYRVEVEAAGDSVAENDTAYAGVTVEGPARVLLAEGMPGAGQALGDALRAGGLEVDRIAAASLPALDRLSTYASTVLVDVDVHTLSTEQIRDLGAATRDLGRGLVAVGGDRSFALGGYKDSDLERLLPVISDVLDPKRRQSVAEVLAIDSSGSMAACHCREDGSGGGLAGKGNFNFGNPAEGGVDKTDISRAAAARAVRALAADDQVGILAFNTEQRFIVPLQQLPSEQVVRDGLRGLKPAGGTDLRQPLRVAAESLRTAKARLKHIVLFTDGFTDPDSLDELVGQARALADEGITVSVLATGEGAAEQLRAVAEAGRGRFYPGRDLHEVPQLMAQEVVIASRNFVNEGEFHPRVVGSSPATTELTESPALLGYLATTAKPTSQTLLEIGEDNDPLLASWRVGLGRSTAWTSDASARWSQLWARWGGYQKFWAAMVKDTFPVGGGAGVRATVDGDRLRVVAESEQPWPEGATAVARISGPDGQSHEVRLEHTSGSSFAGDVEAAAAGSYAVGVSVTGPGGPLASAVTLASRSYAPEYRPGPADPGGLGRLSRLTGGRGAIRPAAAFDARGLPPGRSRLPLAGWLLLLAALAWPVDVALRRLSLGQAATLPRLPQLSAAAAWWARRRRPARVADAPSPPAQAPAPPTPPEPEPVPAAPAPPATLGRLLERKRRDRGEPPG
jgi:Mg-chelatase subunit ChlD